MTAAIIAVDFQRRTRAPLITLRSVANPTASQEHDLERQVRAICAARGIPTGEHAYVVARALSRLRAGDTARCVHAWAREFASDLARALAERAPDPAA